MWPSFAARGRLQDWAARITHSRDIRIASRRHHIQTPHFHDCSIQQYYLLTAIMRRSIAGPLQHALDIQSQHRQKPCPCAADPGSASFPMSAYPAGEGRGCGDMVQPPSITVKARVGHGAMSRSVI